MLTVVAALLCALGVVVGWFLLAQRWQVWDREEEGRARRRSRVGCVVIAGSVWMLWMLWTGYFTGWHVVGPLTVRVVDGEEGAAVSGARVWQWWIRGRVGAAYLNSESASSYPAGGVERVAGGDGVVRFPPLVTVKPLLGMGLAVYAPGYELASWRGVDLEEEGETVRVRRRGLKVEAEVRLRRLGMEPGRWEAHLARINALSQYGYPLPRDLLLDEAYRYVSGGGELTEGMVRTLLPAVGAPIPEYPEQRDYDRTVRAIRWAIVEYCERNRGVSPYCGDSIWSSGYVRQALQSLEGEEG